MFWNEENSILYKKTHVPLPINPIHFVIVIVIVIVIVMPQQNTKVWMNTPTLSVKLLLFVGILSICFIMVQAEHLRSIASSSSNTNNEDVQRTLQGFFSNVMETLEPFAMIISLLIRISYVWFLGLEDERRKDSQIE